jgi:hypothetical protein
VSIDAVIAQARRPGGFAERRRFTLARTQAIQKLRQFALADPAGYILELIQSAVANGAAWIDIHRDRDTLTFAYIGGGIPEAALARLFDYLFAAKDRGDLGYLRDLSLGVNALIALGPAKIVIESGDGTREGTARLELHTGEDRFDVGRPDHALAGTFLRAEGLRGDGDRERSLVETRCRMAPVPIVHNGEALFGHAAMRIPGLPGYRKTLQFDEGDLHGVLGRDPSGMKASVALVTRGVLIEEVEQDLVPGAALGGVIRFDALRKSADHARIVRDERMKEMWLRVRPYALALLGDRAVRSTLTVYEPGGQPLASVPEVRAWLHAAGRVVVVPPHAAPGTPRAEVAAAIAAALEARLLVAPDAQVASLRLLGGGSVGVFAPDLDSPVDLDFYTRPLAGAPPRPWEVQPVDAPPLSAAERHVRLADTAAAAALDAELSGAELRARVYTPAAADDKRTAEVWLLSTGRLLLRAALPSPHAGHTLVVQLPAVSPSRMLAERPGGSLAHRLAAVCLAYAAPALAEAADRALAGLAHHDDDLPPLAAHRALAELARAAVPRLRRRGGPRLEFALVEPGPPGVDLLRLPLLPTDDGPPLSLHALAAHVTAAGGWARTAPPGVRVDPPAPGPLLRLDEPAERHLRALLGDALLRADRPTDLSTGTWQKEPVPTDSQSDPGPRPPDPSPPDPPPDPPSADLTALDAPAADRGSPVSPNMSSGTWSFPPVPPAMDEAGRVHPPAAVAAALRAGRALLVDLALARPPADAPAGGPVPPALRALPATYLALAGAGALLPTLDFDLDDADARAGGAAAAFVEVEHLVGPDVVGHLGVPLRDLPAPGVVVLDAEHRPVHHLRELAHDFGVVGLLRLRQPWTGPRAEAVAAAAQAAAAALYERLLARLPALPPDGPAFARAAAAMLAHAGRRVALVARAAGHLELVAPAGLAGRVLAQPLFPGRRGLPVSALQVLQRHVEAGGDPAAATAALDLAATPPPLRAWLDHHLDPARVARDVPAAAAAAAPRRPGLLELEPDGRARRLADDRGDAPLDALTLATTVEYWLHALRPDLGLARPWDRRGRVWVRLDEARERVEFAEVRGDAATWTITLEPDHWLVQWTLTTARRDREPLAWLLLACFARINEHFDAVTNDHEGLFQRAVADALEQGRLDLLTPRLA